MHRLHETERNRGQKKVEIKKIFNVHVSPKLLFNPQRQLLEGWRPKLVKNVLIENKYLLKNLKFHSLLFQFAFRKVPPFVAFSHCSCPGNATETSLKSGENVGSLSIKTNFFRVTVVVIDQEQQVPRTGANSNSIIFFIRHSSGWKFWKEKENFDFFSPFWWWKFQDR